MAEIYLERENRIINLELKKSKRLKDILDDLNITISSVILTKNGEITLEDDEILDSDKVKILSVVSGG